MSNTPLETEDSIGHAGDQYTQPANATEEAPQTFRATLKYLGPSVIISATIVGSGEIVLTASTTNATFFNFPCINEDGPTLFYRFLSSGKRVRLSTCGENTDYFSALSVEDGTTTCGSTNAFCQVTRGMRKYNHCLSF